MGDGRWELSGRRSGRAGVRLGRQQRVDGFSRGRSLTGAAGIRPSTRRVKGNRDGSRSLGWSPRAATPPAAHHDEPARASSPLGVRGLHGPAASSTGVSSKTEAPPPLARRCGRGHRALRGLGRAPARSAEPRAHHHLLRRHHQRNRSRQRRGSGLGLAVAGPGDRGPRARGPAPPAPRRALARAAAGEPERHRRQANRDRRLRSGRAAGGARARELRRPRRVFFHGSRPRARPVRMGGSADIRQLEPRRRQRDHGQRRGDRRAPRGDRQLPGWQPAHAQQPHVGADQEAEQRRLGRLWDPAAGGPNGGGPQHDLWLRCLLLRLPPGRLGDRGVRRPPKPDPPQRRAREQRSQSSGTGARPTTFTRSTSSGRRFPVATG